MLDRFAASKVLRPHCSECGSSRLVWFLEADADLYLGTSPRAVELVEFMPPNAEFWLCRACGEYGALTAPEWGTGCRAETVGDVPGGGCVSLPSVCPRSVLYRPARTKSEERYGLAWTTGGDRPSDV
jgi:hypothetical protein